MEPRELLSLLEERNLTLASVESMTAGLFGATICSVSGASKTYVGGLITYDPRLKSELANVDPSLIERHGVVSEEVAIAMAEGGANAMHGDVTVSITGNAGPTTCPGYAEVGEAYVGVHYKGNTKAYKLNLSGERNAIREEAVKRMCEAIAKTII